jgi:hypothetical protein
MRMIELISCVIAKMRERKKSHTRNKEQKKWNFERLNESARQEWSSRSKTKE